ncbi:MAG TPA: alginate lyase family protein [Vicinamibacterales bacterium]|nr:alginate lyase family protein [Vicinamibacterales bacterium]
MRGVFPTVTAARLDARAAGPAELFWRAARYLSAVSGALERRFPAGTLGDAEVRQALTGAYGGSPEAWRRHLVSRDPCPFFFSPRDRDEYGRLLERHVRPDERFATLRQGTVCAFGEQRELPEPIDWHRDPASGHRWPVAHWTRLRIAGPPGADVRRVWEVNRQRDLFIFGRAYWRTGDTAFARIAAARVRSWLDANPPEQGVNWWSNLEVALRLQTWLWTLHFFASAPAFDARLCWDLTAAVLAAARHTARDIGFSRRCMPGNHVIGDAAGLAMAALTFPEFREAEAWRTSSLDLLEREAARQVLADGAHEELSPAYHLFVWQLLAGVMLLARRNGTRLPAIENALRRMARAAFTVSTPVGALPPLGDDDGAVAWDLGGGDRMGALAAVAAATLDMPEAHRFADRHAEELLWLIGPSALPLREGGLGGDLPTVTATSFGVAARSSWRRTADFWILRTGGLSKHTHADALNLLVHVDGVPCVIDAGGGGYADPRWRRYFRGSAAHNCLVVDRLDHAEPHRAFRWITPLRASCRLQQGDGAVLAIGEHDGYARIGVRHRRQVLWIPGFGWIVADRLDGEGERLVDLRWLLPGHASPTDRGGRVTCGHKTVDLVLEPFGTLTVWSGSLEPLAGWTALAYDRTAPALALSMSARVRLPFTTATVIAPIGDVTRTVAVQRHPAAHPDIALTASTDVTVSVVLSPEGWTFATDRQGR